MATNDTHCAQCGAEFKSNGISTGYGTGPTGTRHCFECCGRMDRANMLMEGRAMLYLCGDNSTNYHVTNWPGTLSIPVSPLRIGRHNMAGNRYDFWFQFEGENWHGVQYGDNTQVAHCKRVKG